MHAHTSGGHSPKHERISNSSSVALVALCVALLIALRERMGLSTENAHDALQDVKDTANIFIKLLKTHRAVYQNIEFDKAFADGNLYVK